MTVPRHAQAMYSQLNIETLPFYYVLSLHFQNQQNFWLGTVYPDVIASIMVLGEAWIENLYWLASSFPETV